MDLKTRIAQIEGTGIVSAGNRNLLRHLKGVRLTRAQAMKAKCADCMCLHADGCPHCLRHSYASHLIALGEPLPYIQAQPGHASNSLTVDTYGHLIEGANRKAVNRLDDLGKSATPARPAVSGE